ncbi:Ca-activated chloride channel family protein [Amycolatopsis xylanica]|uniref:Ca-activated chloride channel family protein n=1 Tax=Amycolatopsis xylanica TaxID=589385 RepID=A0A1H2TBV6_9PSEU|nr:VWA domain-containing protein [Amycolatopsis xylanica]SDW40744.1 Ca-activated chloride channel family protein [Amycolatopsis xylanica]
MRYLVALLLLTSLMTGCTASGPTPVKLTVLASPELTDLAPVLDDLKHATGIELAMEFRGTVEAGDELARDASPFDLAWLSTNRFLRLDTAAKPQSTSLMLSPLVVGMKAAKAKQLRESVGGQPSWADLADRAALGELKFAMADPRRSSSGMAALIGVATAAAGTGAALRAEDVGCDRIQGFLAGRAFDTAEFVQRQHEADALVTHESEVLSLNASGKLAEPLEVVYPRDGIMLSDYPLTLLKPAQRAVYQRAVDWLRAEPAQRAIMDRTSRRPVDPTLSRPEQLRRPVGNPLYFPDRRQVLDTLLAAYDRAGKGRRVIFVLDYSTSMAGTRVAGLREAFAKLAGFDRFFVGEQVTIIRFASQVLEERALTIGGRADLDAVNAVVASDGFAAGTAIWSALGRAFQLADGGTSIVLMTDGENNTGLTAAELLGRAGPRAKTFAIRFGEANPGELDQVARATGGRLVEAGAKSLLDAVKEIRGC